MEISPEELLKRIKKLPQYNGEVAEYKKSMGKLPEFDYSKFYSSFPEYSEKVLQGDVIKDFKLINLPEEKITSGVGIVLSNSCDIDQTNIRKFKSRMLYAPLMSLEVYIKMLEEAFKIDDKGKVTEEKLYTDSELENHLDDIRKQKVGQVFYLPTGKNVEKEAIIFFDNMNSCKNEMVERTNLETDRIISLSMYGWHILLEKLAYFFTRLTDDTVELRLKTTS